MFFWRGENGVNTLKFLIYFLKVVFLSKLFFIEFETWITNLFKLTFYI